MPTLHTGEPTRQLKTWDQPEYCAHAISDLVTYHACLQDWLCSIPFMNRKSLSPEPKTKINEFNHAVSTLVMNHRCFEDTCYTGIRAQYLPYMEDSEL